MSAILGGGGSSAPPIYSEPAPERDNSAEIQAEAAKARARQRAALGRSHTLIAPLGDDLATGNVARKQLLGGNAASA